MKQSKIKKQSNQVAVTLIKSRFGRLPKHTATLAGLGLRRIRQTVVLEDTPNVRGMINSVSHLLKVEPHSS